MPLSKEPPSLPENPYVPPGPPPLEFEFDGMNTSPSRPGVDDKQAYWLDGFMPLAKRNLRTMYGKGTTLYTRTSSLTVVFFDFYNIGSTAYMVVFLSDGSVVQVRVSDGATTTIMNAGGIGDPTPTNVGTSQWGSQYLIIVANQTNGYWLWNGSVLLAAGTLSPTVSVTNNGSGYVNGSVTVVLIGGHGSGASLSASVNTSGQIVSVSVVNPGSGYIAVDHPSITFFPAPLAGSGASIAVSGSVTSSLNPSGFSISALTVVAGGSLYGPQASITFAGGSVSPPGYQATGFPIISGGSIVSTSITFGGLYFGSGLPTVVITDTGVTASATLTLMPFGVQGTTVETYQGRVWVANGAIVYFSAPGSQTDFSTSNGGGNFTSVDSFLRVGFSKLLSTNGFLYLVGDSSVNYISGVTTSGSPPTTTFTNQNADPEVGSPYPASVQSFGRNVMFSNSYGVHVIAGAAATKVSEPLDGVWASVSNFGGLSLSASKATVFSRRVWLVLSFITNPITGVNETKLLCFDGKRWWATSQNFSPDITYIKHQEINSVITAYGTNGTIVAPLFATPSSSFTKRAQSKLWDQPGGYQFNKEANRFWAIAQYYTLTAPSLVVSIDNEAGTMASPTTITAATAATSSFFIVPPQAVGQVGVLTGMTIHTTSPDMALVAAMIQEAIVQYRG